MINVRHLLFDETCSTAVEYAVMLALILMSVIAAVAALGNTSGGMWGGIDSDLSSHGFGS